MSNIILNATMRTLTDAAASIIGLGLEASNAAAKAGLKAQGRWKVTAEFMHAEGWRFADINPETKSEITKTNRKQLTSSFVEQWPVAKEHANLTLTGAGQKALSAAAKERNREIRQSFGPIMKLIESYLKDIEGIEKPKVEDTDGKKLHTMIENALKFAKGLEAPSAQLARITDTIKLLQSSQGTIDLLK